MRAYLKVWLIGSVLGILILILTAITDAHYPNIPKPVGWYTGTGILSVTQDRLMDREIGLYVLQRLADQGCEYSTRLSAISIFLLFTVKQLHASSIVQNELQLLAPLLRNRYVLAAASSCVIMSAGAWLTSDQCLFLFLSWLVRAVPLIDFAVFGVLCVAIYEQVQGIKRTLTTR